MGIGLGAPLVDVSQFGGLGKKEVGSQELVDGIDNAVVVLERCENLLNRIKVKEEAVFEDETSAPGSLERESAFCLHERSLN
jgi:hypothetical protein